MQKRFYGYDFDSTRIGQKSNATLSDKLYFTSPGSRSKKAGAQECCENIASGAIQKYYNVVEPSTPCHAGSRKSTSQS